MVFNVIRILGRSAYTLNTNVFKQILANGNRLLYTKTALGINGYEFARTSHKRQFTNLEDSFRSRMQEFIEKEDSVIFSEDLKAMLHIVQKDPKDLDLIMQMLKKYHGQKKQLRFANFTFGPVVMRAFYYLDEPDLAFEAFKDPALENFFDQLISCQILMDLLYEHGRYQDVISTFDIFKNKTLEGIVFPRNPSIIAAAACYKLNTQESLDKAVNILKEADDKAVDLPRRALLLIAALAVNCNAPHIAVEIALRGRRTNYIATRCIKLSAYADMGRFTEILMQLRQGTALDNPAGQKWTYFSDTFAKLEAAVQKAQMPEDSEVVQLLQHLKNTGCIQDLTLEQHLCREIGDRNDIQGIQNNRQTRSMYKPKRMHTLG